MNAVDGIVIGGVALNGILFTIIGFGIQRWMNMVEENRKTDREEAERLRKEDREEVRRVAEEVAERAERTAHAVAEKTAATSVEIKDRIESNRMFYAQSYADIKCSIDKLADHAGRQNGRLGHLETDLAKQVAACKVRNATNPHRKLEEE